MPRLVALLRGASPQNCPMPRLASCIARAGFARVTTVLASGNAAFDADAAEAADIPALEARLQALFEAEFGRGFYPILRATDELAALVATDPFARAEVPAGAKRVASFLRSARASRVPMPLSEGGATVLYQHGREGFTVYLPNAHGPVFMKLIERAWGQEVTTRSWDTVKRCATA
jgi:uncharacterized protein (DUF1697 family)